MAIDKNIKILRDKYSLSQKELALIAGVTDKAVSTWESGLKEPRMGAIQKLADHFGLKKSNIIEEDGMDQSFGSTPLKEDVHVQQPCALIPILQGSVTSATLKLSCEAAEYIEISKELAASGEFFALPVPDNSMEPRICQGDIVIVRKQQAIGSGDIALVSINGENASIKKITVQKAGITLIGFNLTAFEPISYTNAQIKNMPIKILGKVVELRAKL